MRRGDIFDCLYNQLLFTHFALATVSQNIMDQIWVL